MLNSKGTIGFTVFAHRVFDLFRDFMRSPAAIRLLVLTLRQTQAEFTRCLTQMLDDLGFDVSHIHRALEQVNEVLTRLREVGVVESFSINHSVDRIKITGSRSWFHGPQEE